MPYFKNGSIHRNLLNILHLIKSLTPTVIGRLTDQVKFEIMKLYNSVTAAWIVDVPPRCLTTWYDYLDVS